MWDHQRKQKILLTPVLPIVIYHGKKKCQKRSLKAYFPNFDSDLSTFLPDFDYVLIDLTTIELQLPNLHSDMARLTGLLLQYSRQKRELVRVLEIYTHLIQNLVKLPAGKMFIETTFIYLNWSSSLTTPEVIAIFNRISTKAGTTAMSAAQKLIKEGIEQGIEKGVRAMLKLGMDAATIAAAFDMPQQNVNKLIEKIKRES